MPRSIGIHNDVRQNVNYCENRIVNIVILSRETSDDESGEKLVLTCTIVYYDSVKHHFTRTIIITVIGRNSLTVHLKRCEKNYNITCDADSDSDIRTIECKPMNAYIVMRA